MVNNFKRTIEDFICEHCGEEVSGTGYTNHCPRCLYSKHVDKNPGDRAQNCGGLMPPIGVEAKNGKFILIHKCRKCNAIKRNKTAPDDNMDTVIRLANSIANSATF